MFDRKLLLTISVAVLLATGLHGGATATGGRELVATIENLAPGWVSFTVEAPEPGASFEVVSLMDSQDSAHGFSILELDAERKIVKTRSTTRSPGDYMFVNPTRSGHAWVGAGPYSIETPWETSRYAFMTGYAVPGGKTLILMFVDQGEGGELKIYAREGASITVNAFGTANLSDRTNAGPQLGAGSESLGPAIVVGGTRQLDALPGDRSVTYVQYRVSPWFQRGQLNVWADEHIHTESLDRTFDPLLECISVDLGWTLTAGTNQTGWKYRATSIYSGGEGSESFIAYQALVPKKFSPALGITVGERTSLCDGYE